MKNFKKKIAGLLAAVMTFASGGITALAADGDVETKYGTVPAEYANKAFAAFTGGNFLGAYDEFYSNTSTASGSLSGKGMYDAVKAYMLKNKTDVQVLLLRDTAMSSESVSYGNLAQLTRKLVVDLNGKTLSQYGENLIFNAAAKPWASANPVVFDTDITMKNGNILMDNGYLIGYGSWDGKRTDVADSVKNMIFNFENINFSFKPGYSKTKLVYYNGLSHQNPMAATFNINYTSCSFDMRNPENNVVLCSTDHPEKQNSVSLENDVNYTVTGSSVITNTFDGFSVESLASGGSVEYLPDADGQYITLTLPEDVARPQATYYINGMDMVYEKLSQSDSYVTYRLVPVEDATVTNIIYEENFDKVDGRKTLEVGNNAFGDAKGWIYSRKNTSKGEAYIENGRMYITGDRYDVVYRDGGETWGNYTLEADFCYTEDNTTGWGGMLYNVQSDTKYQKAGITHAKKYSLNGKDGGWTNDKSGINKGFTLDEDVFGIGVPFRMKVEVYNKTSTFYYAMLGEDGTMKTDFIKLLDISNIPANAQTGSIGFMTSGNGSYGSFWVDNIKCYSNSLISYSENFDSYGDITLEPDSDNASVGVYFEKSNSLANGGAEIKDGALHLSGGGGDFNAVFFNMGKNWTNYVVESDLTYISESNNAGWAGIVFRSTDINNFWKGSINIPTDSSKGTGSMNSQLDGAWYKNSNINAAYPEGPLNYGETVRVRIEVNEKVAKLYAARYTDGVRGKWVHVMTTASEDKFAPIHMKGMIGAIVGGSNNSKEKHICVDNITVSRIPGADRLLEVPNAADIYEPVSGIVNPPVVVEKITASLPPVDGERAAVIIAELDSKLNVVDENGAVLNTAKAFIDTYRTSIIPAFVVDSEAEADALATLIEEQNLTDCYVVATQANAKLVRRVRMANQITNLITGAIIFDDLNSLEARQNARAVVADNMSYVAISKAPLSEEASFYFAKRQIAAWSFADSSAEVYRGISNGYHGIISEDAAMVYDVYESITEPTVSGKTVVIAHRGANGNASTPYPENTLIGMRAAKELYGADAVELDFGLTKDEYVILMHDGTVDRTTDGTGNFSALTLDEIKALTVDYVPGKETTVPTLEEALLLAKELDIVLYCHVKTNTDKNIAAFSHLIKKHNCEDNVLLFTGQTESYNSNIDRVCSGTAYNLDASPVVGDGIIFTAGNKTILEGLDNHLNGVIEMKNTLNKYNYQPIFYPYSNQGDMWKEESFYYQLSARGFVNTHSVTNGQAKMDKIALTESGAVGWLTDNPHLCDDYHYAIDLSTQKTTLKLGEAIILPNTLKLGVGTADAICSLIQVDGKTLTSDGNGYTLNEEGEVTVVFYATRTTEGGTTYRIYSEPVKLTFLPDVTDVEVTKDADTDSCTVKYAISSEDMSKNPVMYIAFYTDKNVLSTVSIIDEDIVSSDQFTVTVPSGNATCKVMLWTSDNYPLCTASYCELK